MLKKGVRTIIVPIWDWNITMINTPETIKEANDIFESFLNEDDEAKVDSDKEKN